METEKFRILNSINFYFTKFIAFEKLKNFQIYEISTIPTKKIWILE